MQPWLLRRARRRFAPLAGALLVLALVIGLPIAALAWEAPGPRTALAALAAAGFPSAAVDLNLPSIAVAELISGVRSDVGIKVYGSDIAEIERIAAAYKDAPGGGTVEAADLAARSGPAYAQT